MNDKPFVYETSGLFADERYSKINIARSLAETATGAIFERLLVEWGKCPYVQDGEDSQGRQRGRLMTPEEIVSRAASAAEEAMQVMASRGWLVELPAPRKVTREERAKDDADLQAEMEGPKEKE